MKKQFLLFAFLLSALYLRAWWDPGHLIVALIAYENLEPKARARVDELTKVLQRDYPYVNHFIATGPWPDDLKAEGVRAYDTWHYTDVPYKTAGVAIPDQPEVDAIWAINQCTSILRASGSKEVDKARFLGFLVHLVGDLHQPLHSTTMYSHDLPGGDAGGNGITLQGTWRNLHALWDDGCGYLSPYNDISPYGQPKEPLADGEINRLRELAKTLMKEFPDKKLQGLDILDPDFWALEGHKLAVAHAYRGVNGKDDKGRNLYLGANGTPSEVYLEQAQRIVRERLATAGYRLARILNDLFKA